MARALRQLPGKVAERRSDAAPQTAEARWLGHSGHLLKEEHPLGIGSATYTQYAVGAPAAVARTAPVPGHFRLALTLARTS
jgi:hypothetical protein